MTLKQKTLSGLFWSFIDAVAGQGINFIVGIVLARLLLPREFGLIGMIMVFLALSEAFINSGFSSALIRKKDCSQTDFSTVFWFNLATGLLVFLALWTGAPLISSFFNEPQLSAIIRVLGIVLVVDGLTLIQRTILTRKLDFKLQARISFIASAGSGILAIAFAYKGFGVWSLVAQRIARETIYSSLLFYWNRWKPQLVFSMASFRELFGFGSKLLASNLIDTFYNNIYYLIIGKYFSASQLGFYTKADEYNRLPSHNISGIIQRVSYPVLSMVQDDNSKLVHIYRRFIRSTMFITFISMLTMAAMAEPLIITLIGEKWRESVEFFRLLCLVGMFYPLHVLNLNIIQAKGRSDLFLKLEVIKKVTAIPAIVLGVIFGIKAMIFGMMANTLLDFYLNNHWSRKMTGYSFWQQVKDIMPSFLMALTVAGTIYGMGHFLPFTHGINLLIQTLMAITLTIILSEVTGNKDYGFMKQLITERFQQSALSTQQSVKLAEIPIKTDNKKLAESR